MKANLKDNNDIENNKEVVNSVSNAEIHLKRKSVSEIEIEEDSIQNQTIKQQYNFPYDQQVLKNLQKDMFKFYTSDLNVNKENRQFLDVSSKKKDALPITCPRSGLRAKQLVHSFSEKELHSRASPKRHKNVSQGKQSEFQILHNFLNPTKENLKKVIDKENKNIKYRSVLNMPKPMKNIFKKYLSKKEKGDGVRQAPKSPIQKVSTAVAII